MTGAREIADVHKWTPEQVAEEIRLIVRNPGEYLKIIIGEGLDGAYISDQGITSPDEFVELICLTRLGDKGKVKKWVKECQDCRGKLKDVTSPAIARSTCTLLASRSEEVGSRNVNTGVARTQVSGLDKLVDLAVGTTTSLVTTGPVEWMTSTQIDQVMKQTVVLLQHHIPEAEQLREKALRDSLNEEVDDALPTARRLFGSPLKTDSGKKTYGRDFLNKFWKNALEIWNNNKKIIRKVFVEEKDSIMRMTFNIRRLDRGLPKVTVELLARLQKMLDPLVFELGYETQLYTFPYTFLCKVLIAHRFYEESKLKKTVGIRSIPGGSLDWLDLSDQDTDLGSEEISMRDAYRAGHSFPKLWLVAFAQKVSFDSMLRYQDNWHRKSWFHKLEDLDRRNSLQPSDIFPGMVVGRVAFVRSVPTSHSMFKQLVFWEVRLLEVFADEMQASDDNYYLLKRLTASGVTFRNENVKVALLSRKLGANLLVPMCNVYANLLREGYEEDNEVQDTQLVEGNEDDAVEGSGSSPDATAQEVQSLDIDAAAQVVAAQESAAHESAAQDAALQDAPAQVAAPEDAATPDVAEQEDGTGYSGETASTEGCGYMDTEEVDRVVDMECDSQVLDNDTGAISQGSLLLPDSRKERDKILNNLLLDERVAKLIKSGAIHGFVQEKQIDTRAEKIPTFPKIVDTPAMKVGRLGKVLETDTPAKQAGPQTRKVSTFTKSRQQVGTGDKEGGNVKKEVAVGTAAKKVGTQTKTVSTPSKSRLQAGTHDKEGGNLARSGLADNSSQLSNLTNMLPTGDTPPSKRWKFAEKIDKVIEQGVDENTPPTSIFEKDTRVILMDNKGLVGKGTFQHSEVGTMVHCKPLKIGQCCVMLEEIELSRLEEFEDLELGSRALWDILMVKKEIATSDVKAKRTTPTEHTIGRLSKVQTNGVHKSQEHKTQMLKKAKGMSGRERLDYLMKLLAVTSQTEVVNKIKEKWPTLWAEESREGMSLKEIVGKAPKKPQEYIYGYLKFCLVNDGLKFSVKPVNLFSRE